MQNTTYKTRQKILNIALGLLALFVLVGSISKIMNWPFPQLLFIGSYVGGFAVLLISHFLQEKRIKELEKRNNNQQNG
jgi:glutaredoxin-related protein